MNETSATKEITWTSEKNCETTTYRGYNLTKKRITSKRGHLKSYTIYGVADEKKFEKHIKIKRYVGNVIKFHTEERTLETLTEAIDVIIDLVATGETSIRTDKEKLFKNKDMSEEAVNARLAARDAELKERLKQDPEFKAEYEARVAQFKKVCEQYRRRRMSRHYDSYDYDSREAARNFRVLKSERRRAYIDR